MSHLKVMTTILPLSAFSPLCPTHLSLSPEVAAFLQKGKETVTVGSTEWVSIVSPEFYGYLCTKKRSLAQHPVIQWALQQTVRNMVWVVESQSTLHVGIPIWQQTQVHVFVPRMISSHPHLIWKHQESSFVPWPFLFQTQASGCTYSPAPLQPVAPLQATASQHAWLQGLHPFFPYSSGWEETQAS